MSAASWNFWLGATVAYSMKTWTSARVAHPGLVALPTKNTWTYAKTSHGHLNWNLNTGLNFYPFPWKPKKKLLRIISHLFNLNFSDKNPLRNSFSFRQAVLSTAKNFNAGCLIVLSFHASLFLNCSTHAPTHMTAGLPWAMKWSRHKLHDKFPP